MVEYTPTNEERSPKWYTNIDLENRYSVVNFPIFLRQRTGELVESALQTEDVATFANFPADRLTAQPFLIPQRCRLDALWFRVTGAGGVGARIRLGVYSDNGNRCPGKLIVDAGEIDATVLGYQAISVNVILNPGIYWLAHINNDGTIDYRQRSYLCVTGYWPRWQAWYKSMTYGVLPDPFPTPDGRERVFEAGYRISEWLE